MFDVYSSSLLTVLSPTVLTYIVLGVTLGLIVGLLPGLGGPVGLAVLLPFTFDMGALEAFAFLLAMLSVTSTASDITAVLFGVPGDSVSAALVMDGHPMAKQGRLGVALGASLTSSLLGAIIGAVALAIALPFLRPMVLLFGSPELFMLTILGITFVASLSQGSLLKGLIAAGLGVALSFVGMDGRTGIARYTFDQLALWDGVGLVAVAVGLFAIPELIDLAVSGGSIGESASRKGGEKQSSDDDDATNVRGSDDASAPLLTSRRGVYAEVLEGARATLQHKALMVRCSLIGVFVGIMPGLGGSVAQWVAYAHAVQSSKDQHEFGTGRIEGIIGPGSANNSKEGGSLIPTIAFGIPGSVTMAVLLGAFLIKGVTPGPSMVGENLGLTVSFIWIIAVANVFAVGAALASIGLLARIAQMRSSLLIGSIALLVLVGAYAEKTSILDLWIVLFFGLLGLIMNILGWPRPPLLLGLVLGALMENYLFISASRYGWAWASRPLVLVIGALAVVGSVYPFLQARRQRRLASV